MRRRIGFNRQIQRMQVHILRAVITGDRRYGIKRAELYALRGLEGQGICGTEPE